jgi:hypothetical protein
MRKSLWIVLTLLLGAGAGIAHADTVTLNVSGSLLPTGIGSSCSGSGCTFGGDIVINNTTGAIISEDVTISGESPSVGPFTHDFGLSPTGGLTQLGIGDSTGDTLNLVFPTLIPGSVIGYNGGTLTAAATAIDIIPPPNPSFPGWFLEPAGALIPAVTPTPEPSSVALMLLGVGLVFVLRKRIGQHLPQAS